MSYKADKKRLLRMIKAFDYLIVFLLLYYLTYNTIYGWNSTPINETEKTLDTIAVLICYIAIGHILTLNIEFIRYYLKKEDDISVTLSFEEKKGV